MVTKTSDAIQKRLNRAIDSWRRWSSDLAERPLVKKQLGGASNSTFLLVSGKSLLVIRLNAEQDLPGVNRIAERWVLEHTSLANIAPSLVHWDQGYMVTEYEQGEHFDQTRHSKYLPEIARHLQQIHCLPEPSFPRLDPFNHLSRYLDSSEITRTELLELSEQSVRVDMPSELQYGVCHNDLNPGNILVTPSGLRFLDWEYANITPTAFEIAVFAVSHGLKKEQLERFLTLYEDTTNIEAIHCYQRLYRLLEILWWRLKTSDQKTMERALVQFLDER